MRKRGSIMHRQTYAAVVTFLLHPLPVCIASGRKSSYPGLA